MKAGFPMCICQELPTCQVLHFTSYLHPPSCRRVEETVPACVQLSLWDPHRSGHHNADPGPRCGQPLLQLLRESFLSQPGQSSESTSRLSQIHSERSGSVLKKMTQSAFPVPPPLARHGLHNGESHTCSRGCLWAWHIQPLGYSSFDVWGLDS